MRNRHYVFFTYTTKGIGGSQLYMLSKAKYLALNGWRVSIVYSQDGVLYLKEFNEFKCFRDANLVKPSFYYFPFKRELLIRKILSFLDVFNDEVVFESHSSNMASWAELVASKIGGVRHIVYEVSETLRPPKPMIEYYEFKYCRHELFGIFDKSIEFFLRNTGVELQYGSPQLVAYGSSDCIYDVPSPISRNNMVGYVIGIVGRLEKEYVLEFAKNVNVFCKNHPEEHFTLVVVGGAPEGNSTKKQIELLYAAADNVRLLFTGYIFPIPRDLVLSFKICLASSGSASAISREGVITIPIDPRDNLANGILGVTTFSSAFSEGEKKSVLWWLEEVYGHPDDYRPGKKDYKYDFESHLECLQHCDRILAYNTSFNNYKVSLGLLFKKTCNTFMPFWMREKIANAININKK